jgi:hypothetical protein
MLRNRRVNIRIKSTITCIKIDGFERLGQVYEARGKKQVAADYYQKAADFAKTMPGFDQESVEYYLSKAKKIREEKK